MHEETKKPQTTLTHPKNALMAKHVSQHASTGRSFIPWSLLNWYLLKPIADGGMQNDSKHKHRFGYSLDHCGKNTHFE
jgi:hypothetical protein